MQSKSIQIGRRSVLASAIASVLASHPLLAQAAEASTQPVTLDMISVKGQATSGVDTVITRQNLDDIQANDLSDVFRADATVTVGGPVRSGQKIYVRGIGEDSLNITVDGAQQAGAIFHHAGRVTIEPDLLKQVEVEEGAGSAAAGPGALGGSILFTTKDPVDLLRDDARFGSMIKGTYFENGSGYNSSATVFGRDQDSRFSGLASVLVSETDDYEDGDGNDIAGSNEQGNVGFLKGVMRFTDSQEMSLSYEKLQREGEILYKPELIETDKNQTVPTDIERETWTLNYDFIPIGNELVELSTTLYQTEHVQDRDYEPGYLVHGTVRTKGINVKNKSRVNNVQFVYGINYRKDDSHLSDNGLIFEEEGEVKGVFFQEILEITDAVTFATGIRYDRYKLEDVADQSIEDSGVSPNASVNWEFFKGYNISLGYAEAFRGPEIRDAYKLYNAPNDSELEGETAKNLELGFDIFQGALTVAGGVFKTRIENPIVNDPPWTKSYTNGEDPIIAEGYFASLAYQWDVVQASVSYSDINAEVDGHMVSRYEYGSTAASVGDTFVTDLSYDAFKKFRIGWIMEWVQDVKEETFDVGAETVTVEKPGYVVHDLYAQWRPMFDDTLLVALTVKNIFDKDYLAHGSVEDFRANAGYESISGQQEPGRDIRLGVTLNF